MSDATTRLEAAPKRESAPDDEARAAELATRYVRLIRSVVSRVGGGSGLRVADEIEQRVLIRIARRLAGEQEVRHPSSYVYRAAVRETVRVLHEEARVERNREAAAETAPIRAPGPQRLAESRELRREMASALTSLSRDRRRATKAHLAGFDVREIMGMFGWSYNQARNLIARGMADLRRALRERGIDG